jgi:hypothetical protein
MSKPKKKRDKPYREKPCVKPLGIRDVLKFEMPALAALEALGRDHFEERHVYDMLSCVDMVRRIAADGDLILTPARILVDVVKEMQQRKVRTGRAGASGEEMKLLREHMGKMITFLRGVPNVDIWRASKAAIDEFNKLGALRV